MDVAGSHGHGDPGGSGSPNTQPHITAERPKETHRGVRKARHGMAIRCGKAGGHATCGKRPVPRYPARLVQCLAGARIDRCTGVRHPQATVGAISTKALGGGVAPLGAECYTASGGRHGRREWSRTAVLGGTHLVVWAGLRTDANVGDGTRRGVAWWPRLPPSSGDRHAGIPTTQYRSLPHNNSTLAGRR